MPAAVRTPIAATLPASSTAWPTGSLAVRLGWGAGRSRRACGRARAGRFFGAVVAVVAVRFLAGAEVFARVFEPLRFSLLRPGRDRGRLPRTPGSSSRSAATRRKIPVTAE